MAPAERGKMKRMERCVPAEKEKTSQRGRMMWADAARSFAILCVVLCHTAEAVFGFDLAAMPQYSLKLQVLAFFLFTAGRLGVPVFLFLSGFLLMDREYPDAQSVVHFWKTHLCSLWCTTQLWLVLYSCFDAVRPGGVPFSAARLARNMLFFEYSYGHMWYMPAILGVYLFLPFVARAVRGMNTRVMLVPFFVAVVYLFGMPTLNVLLVAQGRPPLGNVMALEFGGGTCDMLMMAGLLCRRGCFRALGHPLALVPAAAAFGATVWLQIYSYSKGQMYNVKYDCFLLAFCALCVFQNIRRLRTIPFAGAIRRLSKCSFGIYLVHIPLQQLLEGCMRKIGFLPARIAFHFLVPLAVSWALVYAVGKLPRVGRALFYMK